MAADNIEIEPMDFQEEQLAMSSSSLSDTKFDITIGHIEDIIMEERFQQLQQDFMEKYFMEFEDTEENKFVYTDIHKEYTDLIEKFIEEELVRRMPGFTMEEFSKQLINRKKELDGEVFEMLLTFNDFLAFKEMFIDYRAEKEGHTVDLSGGLTITSAPSSSSSSSFSLSGTSLRETPSK